MKKRISFVATLLLLVTAPALAGQDCSERMIRGRWAFTCDGFVTVGTQLVPIRQIGTCTATEEGLWECEATVSLGGTIIPVLLRGQAIVNEDCTGTITYAQEFGGQPGPDLNIRYVVLDDGDRIKGFPVDPGSVVSCLLDRLRRKP